MSTKKNRQSNGKRTSTETKDALNEAIKDMDTLYNAGCIKWTGNTKVEKSKPYSEVISEELLRLYNDKDKLLEKIKKIDRKKSYCCSHKNSKQNYNYKSIRDLSEKELAKCLCNKNIRGLGYIFDYQIPLKDVRSDNAGEIDLISISNDGKTIFLIELKHPAADDSLLRCCLEIHTYYQQLNREKFIKDIKEAYSKCLEKTNQKIAKKLEDFKGDIKKAIFIFEGTFAAKMEKAKEYRKTRKLMNTLGIKTFVFSTKEIELIIQKSH